MISLGTEKIDSSQFFIVSLLYTLGSAIIFIPHIVIKHAQQNAWIASLLALAIGLLPLCLYFKMNQRFPNNTFIQILEATFGKIGGKIVGFITITGFHLYLTVMTFRDFGDFVFIHLLPETPLHVILILLVIVVTYATKEGLEVIARVGQILVPIVIFLFLLSCVLLLENSDKNNLLPLLDDGWKPVIRATIPNIGFPFLEAFVLLILFSYVKPREKLDKSMFLGVAIGGFMIVIAVTFSLLVFGVEYSSAKIYVPYLLGAEINIANVIQRIEVIIASIWIVSIFIKICILFLTTVMGIQQLFNSSNYRIYVLPLALLIIPLSMMVMPNMSYWAIIENLWPFYAALFAVCLPVVVLIVSSFKRKQGKIT